MTDEERLVGIIEAHEHFKMECCVHPNEILEDECDRAFLLRKLDEARAENAKLLPMSGEAWLIIKDAALLCLAPPLEWDRISESRFREIVVEALRPVTENTITPANMVELDPESAKILRDNLFDLYVTTEANPCECPAEEKVSVKATETWAEMARRMADECEKMDWDINSGHGIRFASDLRKRADEWEDTEEKESHANTKSPDH